MIQKQNIVSEKLANKMQKNSGLRVGVFGGSFDPVHNAHIQCALCAARGLQLDALIMMPSYINPFKLSVASGVASAQDRMNMCKLAVKEMRRIYRTFRKGDAALPKCRFEVSMWEIAQGESGNVQASFTVETLRALRAELPEQVQLFYVLGSDSAKELPSWRNSQELATLATFCVVKRPGVDWTPADDRLLRRTNFNTVVVDGPESNVYSTDIRSLLIQGFPISDVAPASIVSYIEEHGLYKELKAVDNKGERVTSELRGQVQVPGQSQKALGKPKLPDDETLIGMLKERVNDHRFTHIMGVAETARLVAQAYGCDQAKAYTAGLLHDWDKCYTDDEIRQRVQALDVSVDSDVLASMAQTIHGLTAAAYFEQTYVVDPEIVQAVARHTTGAVDMTPLDMCLYIADALEPNRQMAGVDDLRGIIGKADLEDLFFAVYGFWMCLVIQRRRTVHPDSLIVWNSYAVRYAKRHGFKFDAIAKSV